MTPVLLARNASSTGQGFLSTIYFSETRQCARQVPVVLQLLTNGCLRRVSVEVDAADHENILPKWQRKPPALMQSRMSRDDLAWPTVKVGRHRRRPPSHKPGICRAILLRSW